MRIGWRTDNPPNEIEDYLVTLDSGDITICKWCNWNRIWVDLISDWHWWNTPQYTKVVAWMVLPEAYKVEEDNGFD